RCSNRTISASTGLRISPMESGTLTGCATGEDVIAQRWEAGSDDTQVIIRVRPHPCPRHAPASYIRHMARWFLPLFFFLALMLSGGSTVAQSNEKTKVVLYKDRVAAKWDTVNCVKNVLKFNPLLFLRGEIPIYY